MAGVGVGGVRGSRGHQQERDGEEGGKPAAPAAAPAPVLPVISAAEHRRAHMKTPTMPDDRAISVSPARTHGIPLAPSAASEERLRRPIAIIAPQPISPNTPATKAPHFHQASSVFTGPVSPGGAFGAGFGTPPAKAPACSA